MSPSRSCPVIHLACFSKTRSPSATSSGPTVHMTTICDFSISDIVESSRRVFVGCEGAKEVTKRFYDWGPVLLVTDGECLGNSCNRRTRVARATPTHSGLIRLLQRTLADYDWPDSRVAIGAGRAPGGGAAHG